MESLLLAQSDSTMTSVDVVRKLKTPPTAGKISFPALSDSPMLPVRPAGLHESRALQRPDPPAQRLPLGRQRHCGGASAPLFYHSNLSLRVNPAAQPGEVCGLGNLPGNLDPYWDRSNFFNMFLSRGSQLPSVPLTVSFIFIVTSYSCIPGHPLGLSL
jgi:hypothetical protein